MLYPAELRGRRAQVYLRRAAMESAAGPLHSHRGRSVNPEQFEQLNSD
jgi:hypothetical protein